MHAKKTAFVVEHDFIMATYLADRYGSVLYRAVLCCVLCGMVHGVVQCVGLPLSLLFLGINVYIVYYTLNCL